MDLHLIYLGHTENAIDYEHNKGSYTISAHGTLRYQRTNPWGVIISTKKRGGLE